MFWQLAKRKKYHSLRVQATPTFLHSVHGFWDHRWWRWERSGSPASEVERTQVWEWGGTSYVASLLPLHEAKEGHGIVLVITQACLHIPSAGRVVVATLAICSCWENVIENVKEKLQLVPFPPYPSRNFHQFNYSRGIEVFYSWLSFVHQTLF